ncbi:response regulator transcription factor [Actinophytocola sp.]|jgi:DNA-binding NarL/FixJ family response regulator|uniref:response regulator transcription factor n=1 Tax=Actinophytocola sp. TaxID=1872138 RepID=UPI002D3AE74D|nr:response regulator transcription factor [Actinophytocola sp.]HYQ65355.1 response regulator transcription factor [Actinophytocola sp.]
MPIRVLVADDQTLVRTGFRLILNAEPDIEVVSEAADGQAAVRLARKLRPDVVLMDLKMPVLDGIRATRMLAGADVPDPLRVVVVTTYDIDENVYAALLAGACGFLLKDAGPALLIEAVRAAAKGEAMVSPSVTVRLLAHFTRTSGPPAREPVTASLTARELDVVLAVAAGKTNAEICAELHISLSTVKSHLASVQGKVNARNRTEIAIWAWQHQLVR